MIRALVEKDLRLLRNYLRGFAGALLICFVAAGIITIMTLENAEIIWKESTAIFATTLSGGSFLSIIVSLVFASLLAGSVVPLERADRSSQFLACLPPTRFQIFSSKLLVVVCIVSIAFCFCLLTWFAANRLIHFEVLAADANGEPSTISDSKGTLMADNLFFWFALFWDDVILHPFIAAITSVVGGSLIASLWSRSNAAPTIYGVLTPIVIFIAFLTSIVTHFPDLPEDLITIALSMVFTSIGLGCITAAGYGYLIQREY